MDGDGTSNGSIDHRHYGLSERLSWLIQDDAEQEERREKEAGDSGLTLGETSRTGVFDKFVPVDARPTKISVVQDESPKETSQGDPSGTVLAVNTKQIFSPFY